MNEFLFGGMPHVLVITAIVGSIWRYTTNKYTWSSQSS
jgi:nitrate reductase gamma subunit